MCNANLKYTDATQKCFTNLEAILSKVDKSGMPVRFTAWIYQYDILPKIMWSLNVIWSGIKNSWEYGVES